MNMGVVKAGEHGLAVEVDHASPRALGLQYRGIAANGDEAPVADCSRMGGREPRVDRDDMRSPDDEVGRSGRRHCGRGAEDGNGQGKATQHGSCPGLEGEAGAEAEEAIDDVVELTVGAAFVDSAGGTGRDHRWILVEEVVDRRKQLDGMVVAKAEAVARRRIEIDERWDAVAVDRIGAGAFVKNGADHAGSNNTCLKLDALRATVIV